MENHLSASVHTTHSLIVPQEEEPKRADLFISQQFPLYSRTFFQTLIDQNLVMVNNKKAKASTVIKPFDQITVQIPPVPTINYEASPEIKKKLGEIDVNIVHEEREFLIISKPAGLMTHKPSPYNTEITLVDWLLSQWHQLALVGHHDRPGIVHRLDKDTSGLMIIPRTNHAHMIMSDLFKQRAIKKKYIALVHGHPARTGTIEFPIARDNVNRNKMTHTNQSGRPALTHFVVKEYFENSSLIEVSPITGRTHQIRVHCAAIGHPLIGDHLYGTKSSLISRHALHATSLTFAFNGKPFVFNQEMPMDMQQLINQLKKTI
ncbi:MAG: Ribosomal large subunit pseudouridine synthase D [Candidatus Dependentiae bacterium ADurb.Bin331]|nr:MAG: Ribosomal large subunit pseudouridine synthase D [Candidatus Dependentiae bacterium ADurb.Bin331]